MDQLAFYEIRVQGQLDESWSDWFGGLAIAPQTNGETLLTGPIIDQAALHGTLDKLYAMNLPLLSVVRIETDPEVHKQSSGFKG
jgi:hypothetical protein